METALMRHENMGVESMKGSWGWFLVLGIMIMVLGIAAISVPIAVSVTMTVFLGIILLFAGLAQFAHSITAYRWKGFFLHMLGSVILVIFGVALLAEPERGIRALTLLLAIYFLSSGFVRIVMSIISRGEKNWGWLLFSGIVNFVLGALIWSQWPSSADWVIGLLIGIDLFLSGWAMIMLSIAARTMPAETS